MPSSLCLCEVLFKWVFPADFVTLLNAHVHIVALCVEIAIFIPSCCSASVWYQIPQRKIVDNILNLLHIVLNAIASPSQRIVLEIQDLETSMEVLHELADLQRSLVVSEGN